VNPEIVELLLNNGANPNFMSSGLSLPLYHAIELAEEASDYEETDDPKLLRIIELLVNNGADTHLINCNGKSPYQYAESRYLPAKNIFDSYG
jgi:ankyrin repeat protein